MGTGEHVPSDQDMRRQYVAKRMHDGATRTHAEQEYTRWLAAHDARVRRDAAREALNGFAQEVDANGSWWPGTDPHSPRARAALNYRDAHYSEEAQ